MKNIKLATLISLAAYIILLTGLLLNNQPVSVAALPQPARQQENKMPVEAAGLSQANTTQSPAGQTVQNPPAKPSATAPSPQTPAPAAPPKTDNRCIITISGGKYDVTDFRNIHSGGNIFQCNTDMTQTFFSMHDSQLLAGQMARYKIN